MFDPIATYRIQFNKEFTFRDLDAIIPYLVELGIKTIYASPIFQAVPGSMHGYDVVNPNRINPEIGTIEELRDISSKLKEHGMHWIQDIVPNHMGFHQENEWLMDVLKNGETSVYRTYFDLVTTDLNMEPLMVPFLGDDLDVVIDNGDLELVSRDGASFLKYHESQWPVRQDITLGNLDIRAIAELQYYRLCCHKETNKVINYRRFFTVNNLICLNVQLQEVFEDYHRLTKTLIDEGVFQGLRIDHVDGLADPTGYLKQLRELCGEETYIVVEKILEAGEELPLAWPVQGTTGYDYLGMVNQLFTNDKAERKFDAFYKGLGRHSNEVGQLILKKKRAFLDCYMQGELENLYQLLFSLELLRDEQLDDREATIFREVLAEILVRFPVYRFYSNKYPLQPVESKVLAGILQDIESADSKFAKSVKIIRKQVLPAQVTAEHGDRVLIFFKRLMQFTGPLMAKGVEDTLMYTYNRFIGNNEVGDSPEIFGTRPADFHEQIELRQRYWPNTMNATATHDTKRGEDARTRLTVLTDLRKEWLAEVKEWRQTNERLKMKEAPDANDEYFIYQTLVATYPEGDAVAENYDERVLAYIEKALRESKRNSEWNEPDLEYEGHTKEFIQKLLDPQGEFWGRFSTFHKRVAAAGRMASLSSLLLKHTLPGVPDTYQGTELWDLSMVDPDNRRPVDYQHRAALLVQFSAGRPKLEDLWEHGEDGQIKLFLLYKLLRLRGSQAQLFSDGLYIKLELKGRYAENVISFARRYKGEWLVVAAAVNLPIATLGFDWEDTRVVLPKGLPENYEDILHNSAGKIGKEMKLSEFFSDLPMAALLFKKKEQKRGAGVLMHISSLPSAYGIGDIGPSARQFLDFLAGSGLKYWQVLPMNPISSGQSYSPYSATSVMAGNTLLISPEDLYEDRLISGSELKAHKRKIKRNVSYSAVSEMKVALLKKAYQTWRSMRGPGSRDGEMEAFCLRESNWLDDYSLFVLIGNLHGNQPWTEWPAKYRDRQPAALSKLKKDYYDRLTEIKWQQFIFFRQWNRLKAYAAALDIGLIGDLPFYAALDSADVWTNRGLFSIGADGKVAGVAGVPPDYFNADGQLWGMPVYDWKAMKKTEYKWWINRLSKNFELYDLLRLDHFRAFASYWEVPAGCDTAKKGSWRPGPGADFFSALQSRFKSLPLIAEDLGEITQEVFDLRDKFELPGMKVLQFAFGEDIAQSIHAPHNFSDSSCIVYTGTHDNNTTCGWYEEEADDATKKRMADYAGTKITKRNAANVMIRLALSSIADIAIIPMQDLLNKSANNRMNTPASVSGNWTWRLKPGELKPGVADMIAAYIKLYGR